MNPISLTIILISLPIILFSYLVLGRSNVQLEEIVIGFICIFVVAIKAIIQFLKTPEDVQKTESKDKSQEQKTREEL